ncbi:hypothetical protein Tco_0790889 [Tanacetum coccineum]
MEDFDKNPAVNKVASLEAEKVKLKAVEASLRQELLNAKLDRAEVVSKVVPYVAMKLVNSDDMGRLVAKLRLASTRTHVPASFAPSQKATPSPALMSPPSKITPAVASDSSMKATSLSLPSFLLSFELCSLLMGVLCTRVSGLGHPPILAEIGLAASRCGSLSLHAPLSSFDVIAFKIPNLHMMCYHMNYSACFPFAVVTSLASIHFVKCSTTIARNFKFPGAVGRGPSLVLSLRHPYASLFKGLPFEARMRSSPNYNLKPSNSFEWCKTIFGMVTSMGICHMKPYTLRGGPSMKLEQRREITPPPGFSAIPITTTMFVATTLKNTPMAYRASTSANPNPVIIPNFVEANYEALESLLRDRRRQMCNNDLRTKLEYFSKDYNEEREMELRPKPTGAATPPLRVASPRIRSWGKEKWGSKELRVEGKAGLKGILKGKAFRRSTQGKWRSKCESPSTFSSPFRERREWSTFAVFFDFRLWRSYMDAKMVNAGSLPYVYIYSKTLSEYGGTVKKQILGLHEEQQILGFVHGLRTKRLVEHLSTDLPSTYKGLTEKTYTWVEAREVATNGASSDQRDSFKKSKKSSWDNNRGHKNKDRFSPYRGPNHGLLPSMSKSPKEILAMEKAARSFEPPPKMFGMKGIKKERTKSSNTPRGEIKKEKGTAPVESPILMVSREDHIVKSLGQENTDYGGKEIIFPPVAKVNNAPVIIEAKIFGRKVGRVYMDSGSSCEIIYEHCFEKLNPTIKATKVDLKTPLVGFSRERSWSIGEVPLEITVGDAPPLKDKNS